MGHEADLARAARVLHQNVEELVQKWKRDIEEWRRLHEHEGDRFNAGYFCAMEEHAGQLEKILAAKDFLVF